MEDRALMPAAMKALVLVPVFNEWPHLRSVLCELREHVSDILVIDDGSDDASYLSELEKDRFDWIRLPFNIGHWGAIQAGFQYALSKGCDYAVTFDGDGQHLPQEIHRLTTPIAQGVDLVIGGDRRRGGNLRRFSRTVLKWLSGVEVSDFTSGFRAYSRRAMQMLVDPVLQNFEFQDLGVLVIAQKKGLTMLEVPVHMGKRRGMKSKVFPGGYSVLRYFLITLTFLLVRRP
jgi:glycosyltransferase involved in cell wall biosynthesis